MHPGNETDIAQDELQRGLDPTYLINGAAGVDANFRVTCGLTYGVVLIGNAGSGYVAGETFTLPYGTAFQVVLPLMMVQLQLIL